MYHQDSMDCRSSEPTHQGIQILREHRSKLVVDVLARWSIHRLCIDQLLSPTNRHFQTRRRRIGERNEIPHHEEKQARKGKQGSVFFYSSCWKKTTCWSGPPHGKPLITPMSSTISRCCPKKRSVISLWVGNSRRERPYLYEYLFQVCFNWNVLHLTPSKKLVTPAWREPSPTVSKGVDHSPTLSAHQPSRHTVNGEVIILRFNSPQMKSLVGGATVRSVAESLDAAVTFHQWSGFCVINDRNPKMHTG